MTAAYYSQEADIALLSSDDGLGHLFPSSTCSSPPSIMYSPPLHQTPNTTSAALPGSQLYASAVDYGPVVTSPYPPHSFWAPQLPTIPQSHMTYSTYPPMNGLTSEPSLASHAMPLPNLSRGTRSSRSHSAASSLGVMSNSTADLSPPPLSRPLSPGSPDLRAYGFTNKNGTWSCAYPGCTSRAVFTRGCDLRKHHKRHTKSFFCRHEGCPQATGGGFSSKKDLARHEAKHNPGVLCDWDGCERVFSRVDNMRDHVKRIHLKATRSVSIPKALLT